jgi:hypothetical protein
MASKHDTKHGEQLVASTQQLASTCAANTAVPTVIEMPDDPDDLTVWKQYTTLEEVDAELEAIRKRQELRAQQGSTLEGRQMLEEMLKTGWMAFP